ncbi:nascent polypeptide-associated complex subunit alpha, muscle-specific form-like isoform X2 [Macrosteles quadrilineatus]|uniref:nascent polypeptide-associated complex subunit alpha, muscle-specific form-like isoform X2 n=1 Tax=Macrosteles quadrilineatus TaxID=74068 RepID=UPI0023E330AC|nr:nascent polypeptide-associated complex subunit alpha, muscle-specific form-like isoform X2 [Macrosteles quadrilineatus]
MVMNGIVSSMLHDTEWKEGILSCVSCHLKFTSFNEGQFHHLQHIGDSSVYLTKLNSKLLRRLQAGKPLKKRPGPKCKTLVAENLPPKPQHSPLKLTFKRLPTCREPVFEVVKKKGRVKSFAAMDDMIPEGRGVLPSQSQTTSPTPIDILREEGFLAPEALEENEEKGETPSVNGNPPAAPKEPKRGKKTKEKDKEKEKQQEDSGISSNSEPEPSDPPPPTEPAPSLQSVENEMERIHEGQKSTEQESSDSGCEKDGSETDFSGEKNKEPTPPPALNPSPVGSLTVLAPSALNSSVVNGALPSEPLDSSAVMETFNSLDTEQPLPPPPPVLKEGVSLTVKTPAALGATITPNLLNILPETSSDPLGLLRGFQPMEPSQSFIMETCEVCGERSDNIEQHRATMGHYKCHVLPECAGSVFANQGELTSHQHVVHGLSPTPQQQSLQQLQQQVQRLPVPYGIPTPPPAMGTPPPAISPSLGYRVPSGVTLTFPGASPSTPTITPRQFAMQTSPSTIQPDGSPVPVASPTLPAGLGRSISISPSIKTAQKRATPSPAESEASKRSRPESPDCMLVEDGSAPPKVPTLPSGISLTVRGSQSQNSGVANILASRGITVTPAANKTPPPLPASNRASVTAQPVTTLNLSSAVSIVPASQSSRGQFAVPTDRNRGRQVTSTVKPFTVDLTQDSDRPSFRRRPQRFTCQFCDKVFTTQETLNTHLATHRSPGKLPYKCNLCNAQYPTQQAMLQHKQNYHKEAQGSEMALPVVDMKNPASINKLTSLGIRHCLVLSQLTNSSGGVFGLPIVAIDNAKNPAVCNLGALGASNVLSLGPAKALR